LQYRKNRKYNLTKLPSKKQNCYKNKTKITVHHAVSPKKHKKTKNKNNKKMNHLSQQALNKKINNYAELKRHCKHTTNNILHRITKIKWMKQPNKLHFSPTFNSKIKSKKTHKFKKKLFSTRHIKKNVKKNVKIHI